MALHRRFSRYYILALKLTDILFLTATSTLFCTLVEACLKDGYLPPLWVFTRHKATILTYLFFWILLSFKRGFYHSWRIDNLVFEFLDVLKISTLSAIFTFFALMLVNLSTLEREGALIFWLGNTASLICFRASLRSYLRWIRKRGFDKRNFIIVGTNKRSMLLLKSINKYPEFGLSFLGFVDDETYLKKNSHLKGKGIKTLKEFEEILSTHSVDIVFITLPLKSYYSQIEKIVHLCDETGTDVKVVSDLFNIKVARRSVGVLEGVPLVSFTSGPEDEIRLLAKRCIDIAVSLVVLILVSPLLIVIAVLVKLTSSGPVFFAQERVGYHQRRFNMLKFRSMVVDAEEKLNDLEHLNEVSGPVFKIKKDPRITPIGHILRKFSLDELPQFINVLKGDMSLVGPRPLPTDVRKYKNFQKRRHSMKPGLTCLWQIRGRNAIPFEEWMKLDLKYIDNWSLALDFIILCKTIPAVVKGKGY